MNKFNNTLEGTDCGDAGLSTPCRNTARPDRNFRIVPKRPKNGAAVIQFPMRGGTPAQERRPQCIGRWKGELG
jgi:hypothetical protein